MHLVSLTSLTGYVSSKAFLKVLEGMEVMIYVDTLLPSLCVSLP